MAAGLCARCGTDLRDEDAVNLADIGLDAGFCGPCARWLRSGRQFGDPVPADALCESCGEHKATLIWSEHDVDALNHGAPFEWWCECCSLKAAIVRAEKELAGLPGRIAQMTRELAEACPQ